MVYSSAGYTYPDDWKNFTGEPPIIVIDNALKERIKSIYNQCIMFLMLCDVDGADKVIATLLEDMYYRSQLIIEEYCKEGEE